MNDKILFIMTGGTIDSYYEPTKDTAVPNEKSAIPKFIKSLKLYESCEFIEVCMRDSRDLTKNDIKNITKTIENSKAKRIIITHGTYTMPDTAKYLKANLKNQNKTIILTGSMIPLVGFSPSDAPFNLGYSIAQSEILENGIYVCMNGRVFSPDEILKTLNEGKFSSIFDS